VRKGISQWSFPAGYSLRQCCELARKAGFDSLEVAMGDTGEITRASSRSDVERVRAIAGEAGVEVCSLATGLFWNHSLSSDDPQVRAEARDIVKKMLETATWLGVDTILVVPGAVDVFFNPNIPVVSYDAVYRRAVEALAELAPLAAQARVTIGVENVWNRFLLSPLEARRFIDEINSPFVKMYFDVGNVVPFGYPEQWIRILGSRIAKVHVKDFRRSVGTAEGFVNLLYGDVNWPAVMAALHEIGYDGHLTAEVFPGRHHPESLIFETSASMDFILGRR